MKFVAYSFIERIVQKEEKMEMCGIDNGDKFFVKAYTQSYVDGKAKENLAQVVGPLTLCYAEALAQTLAVVLDNQGYVLYSKIEVVEKSAYSKWLADMLEQ